MPAKRAQQKATSVPHFQVVGIGASAGGLRAIQNFFDNVPPTTGMCFVVVVHLDPNQKSQMAALVQKHTTMPVSQPERGVLLEPNHVYIIPPDKDFSMLDGHINTSPRSRTDRARAPIDHFFATLAESHQSDAVAIVLTGTGGDGSKGVGAIREHGGITMAQAVDDAEFAEMPMNAIATGNVDIVLPIAELAATTTQLKANRLRLHVDDKALDESDEALIGRILTYVRAKTGHDFAGYRRATVLRRLERRMHLTQAESLADYLRQLSIRPDEATALFNDLLITVSSFFRDPAAFEALEREVVPRIFAEANAEEGIRVWVAGCATGEEAYTLAILLCEYAVRLEKPPHVQIFATDVHEKSFAFARAGAYPDSIAADVSADRLRRFFDRTPRGYRVKKELREKVVFANHDVLRDPPFIRLDLITCRNLLIYLNPEAKRRVESIFHFGLRTGGYLMLGSSEGMEHGSKFFAAIDKKNRIFESLGRPRSVTHGVRLDAFEQRVATAPTPDPRAQLPVAWSLHHQFLEAYAAPSVLVNSEGAVLHFSSNVGAYLLPRRGEPSDRLEDMLPRGARMRVRASLTRAFANGRPVRASDLRFVIGGKTRVVDIVVAPVKSERGSEKAALVLFEESTRSSSRQRPTTRKGSGKRPIKPDYRQAQRELNGLKQELQATIKENDAVLEEARAANEELQSINEEQRATAEELATSKEELQSVNEELRTINQEYRNQNDQLAQTNSDLESLIDSTGIGTIFLDGELRVRRYTPPVTDVFNFVESDRGRRISDVTNRLRYPDLIADLSNALETQTRVEREVISESGRWFLVRIAAYRSADNRVEGVVLTLTDINDRKRSELEREIAVRDIVSSSNAKSNFIAVMSHELRTPLNAIVGYAGIMKAGAVGVVSAEQDRQLQRISDSALHLSSLLDDSLEAARMEQGTTVIRHEAVDLTFLVREVYESVVPLAAKRGLQVILSVEEGLSLVTDGTKVRQILVNLLSNALRYSDVGTITVGAGREEDNVVIAVGDTGIGIAPEYLEKIFERFWQVDQSLTRTRGGTGLGLMVSRGLARQLGGDVEVRSKLGVGSTFILKLPLATE